MSILGRSPNVERTDTCLTPNNQCLSFTVDSRNVDGVPDNGAVSGTFLCCKCATHYVTPCMLHEECLSTHILPSNLWLMYTTFITSA